MQEYEKIFDFRNLYNAYRKARKGKRWKEAAVKFEINLLEAIALLKKQIKTKTTRYLSIMFSRFMSQKKGLL